MPKHRASLLSDFKLGAASLPSPARPPKGVRDAIAYLDRLPFKTILRARGVAKAIRRSHADFRAIGPHEAMKLYRHDFNCRDVVWGSRKTIRELKRRLNRK